MKKLRRDGIFSPWAEVGVGAEFLRLGPACVAVCFPCISFCFNKRHLRFCLVIASLISQDHINRYNFNFFINCPQNYLSANEI